MQRSCGDLLIGGLRMRGLPCQLQREEMAGEEGEWLFAGQLYLTPDEAEQLELNRLYRLQLEDGRSGAVLVTGLWPDRDKRRAEFGPHSPPIEAAIAATANR